MKDWILAPLAAALLLGGCAAGAGGTGGQDTLADRNDPPTGTFIKRKGGTRPDNVTTADKQALENDRIMGNGSINLPQR